jgi:formylglycine-generating enzyme required for sulfatase activity
MPAGAFLMGSDSEVDHDAAADELPKHWVEVVAFQIATYPVTVSEYACFVQAGHPAPRTTGSAYPITWHNQCQAAADPVVGISWQEATQYAAWLAELTGQPWRLPTEAEWEKAARWDGHAGVSRIYPWGDQFDDTLCNSFWNTYYTTSQVGEFPLGSSPVGAQDMAGNVWEMTSSLYWPYPYVATDGREVQNAAEEHVLRGGSYGNNPLDLRSACRSVLSPPDDFDDHNGFRLVRSVVQSGSAMLD